ncbi:MAG: hypothetical protein GXY05_15385, partial [Clostridiales bacterium]|nr:hypothetical protein [Clostridiales bacterium]
MNLKTRPEGFKLTEYLLFAAVMLGVMILCISIGSVNIPLKNTATAIWNTV